MGGGCGLFTGWGARIHSVDELKEALKLHRALIIQMILCKGELK